jgi:hypothetical protein
MVDIQLLSDTVILAEGGALGPEDPLKNGGGLTSCTCNSFAQPNCVNIAARHNTAAMKVCVFIETVVGFTKLLQSACLSFA